MLINAEVPGDAVFDDTKIWIALNVLGHSESSLFVMVNAWSMLCLVRMPNVFFSDDRVILSYKNATLAQSVRAAAS